MVCTRLFASLHVVIHHTMAKKKRPDTFAGPVYYNHTAAQLVQTSTQRITELFENAKNRIKKLDYRTR